MAQMRGRRRFLREIASAAGVLAVAGCAGRGASASAPSDEEDQVSPAEDLMREHGVLNRVLLIYEEAARRLETGETFDLQVLVGSGAIVRTFVEDYHEQLEETHVFPRFEKSGTLVELVTTLRAQHAAGRRLTDEIAGLAGAASPERRNLAAALRRFIRMYRPHEAREDTVLFPALHKIVTGREWDALGEQFEDEEHARFGRDGFEDFVGRVAGLERSLGIDDLSKFTPV